MATQQKTHAHLRVYALSKGVPQSSMPGPLSVQSFNAIYRNVNAVLAVLRSMLRLNVSCDFFFFYYGGDGRVGGGGGILDAQTSAHLLFHSPHLCTILPQF